MFKKPELEILFNLMQAQMYISAANRMLQGVKGDELSCELLDISIAIAKLSIKMDENNG